jgi:hypothetical protein
MKPLDTFPPTRQAALARIDAVRPSDYARSCNALEGAVTYLSPYITHGLVSLPEVLAGVTARHPLDAQHASSHKPLIEQALWDEVHELMASRARRTGVLNRKSPEWQFPLKGLVFGEDGRSMTPWFSSKQRGRQLGYYIPQKEISVGAGASGLPRLSAYHLHAQVMEHLYENFRDPSQWLAALPKSLTDHPTFDQALITERLRETARVSDLFSLPTKAQLIRLLVERVVVGPNDFLVRISAKGVFELICDLIQAHTTDWVSQIPDQTPRK